MTQRFWSGLYNGWMLPLALMLMKILSLRNAKIRDTLNGRQGLWDRIRDQLSHRDSSKPLIWFHVSSVGEYLQAQPVLQRCQEKGMECAVTFTSISGYKWTKRARFPEGKRPVVLDFLPLDFRSNIRRCLEMMSPTVMVYVKFDLWPNLIWEAHRKKIPQFLISGTLQANSFRFNNALGRAFYKSIYACLKGIFAVTDTDSNRFLSTAPQHPNVKTLGDTRFDSVIDRRDSVPKPKLPGYVFQKQVFIAGSSWPPDEDCIFPGLKKALEEFPDLLVIMVPHEPTPEHLESSENFFGKDSIVRWSELEKEKEEKRVILIDTIGILSSLYYAGNLAYVGGAFTTGVHNTMEPCAMGLPVIFGPRFHNSPEAEILIEKKLAFTVSNPEAFQETLFSLLRDPDYAGKLGKDGKDFVESQSGAADQCFQFIQEECYENSLSESSEIHSN